MTRPRPPYLLKQINRHGKVVWYVRKGKGPRIRVRGDYGSADFMANYQAAINGENKKPQKATSGSLEWLISRYRESSGWIVLSAATRKQRDNIFKQIVEKAGKEAFVDITRKVIVDSREARRHTPSQARNFLDAMRGLFRWAVEAEYIVEDPTAGVSNPKRPKNEGFPVWAEDDIMQYEKRWPIGTKERVWLDVLLYTGLRRGDAVRIGRQHLRDGIATLKTEKSKYTVEVTIPILPILQTTLDAGPTGDLSFICGNRGQPLTKESFGNMFRTACREAKVNKSAHGVRKIGATRAANAGATVAQLEAIFGWNGGAMASHYTKSADRRRLAKEAISKLSPEHLKNGSGTF